MREIPDELLNAPFTRSRALDLGVSKTMLAGARFVRVHPRVWRHRDHQMTWNDEIVAARLALPEDARLTHITRIRLLGLDHGPCRPLHFVIEGELHLDLDGIFLHRTKQLAPCDETAVSPAAAYTAYCSSARLVDAIVVGDWLLAIGMRRPGSSSPWRSPRRGETERTRPCSRSPGWTASPAR